MRTQIVTPLLAVALASLLLVGCGKGKQGNGEATNGKQGASPSMGAAAAPRRAASRPRAKPMPSAEQVSAKLVAELRKPKVCQFLYPPKVSGKAASFTLTARSMVAQLIRDDPSQWFLFVVGLVRHADKKLNACARGVMFGPGEGEGPDMAANAASRMPHDTARALLRRLLPLIKAAKGEPAREFNVLATRLADQARALKLLIPALARHSFRRLLLADSFDYLLKGSDTRRIVRMARLAELGAPSGVWMGLVVAGKQKGLSKTDQKAMCDWAGRMTEHRDVQARAQAVVAIIELGCPATGWLVTSVQAAFIGAGSARDVPALERLLMPRVALCRTVSGATGWLPKIKYRLAQGGFAWKIAADPKVGGVLRANALCMSRDCGTKSVEIDKLAGSIIDPSFKKAFARCSRAGLMLKKGSAGYKRTLEALANLDVHRGDDKFKHIVIAGKCRTPEECKRSIGAVDHLRRGSFGGGLDDRAVSSDSRGGPGGPGGPGPQRVGTGVVARPAAGRVCGANARVTIHHVDAKADSTGVRRGVRAQLGRLKCCYERHSMAGGKGPHGLVSFKLNISDAGGITGVTVTLRTKVNQATATCQAAALRRLSLKTAPARGLEASVTLRMEAR